MMNYDARMDWLRHRILMANMGTLTVRDDPDKTLVSTVAPDQLRMLGDNWEIEIQPIEGAYYNIDIYEKSTDREFSLWLMYQP